jgi:uncharacterized protein YwqG
VDDSGDEALLKKLSGLKRKAWLPVTEERNGPVTASKFSGTPWLGPQEAWPACPRCHKPMALFLQLDLAGLPEGLGDELGQGLLQMFYCTSRAECTIKGEGCWEPFSPYQLLRRVQPTPGAQRALPPAFDVPIPARTITGWDATDDYPHPYECEDYGIEIDDSELEVLIERGYPRQGDKLLGWPAWVQHVDYPRCRQCGGWMWLVFQIDSHCNLCYMFGDNGCGHITQCPEHPDELAFVWACC